MAEDLYALRGDDSFSFGQIAAAVQTTGANIHHHFRDKQALMAELIDQFAADAAARIDSIGGQPGRTFAERMAAQRDDLRRFHKRFNPRGGDRHACGARCPVCVSICGRWDSRRATRCSMSIKRTTVR